MGVRVVGPQSQGLAELAQCLVDLSLSRQGDSEVVYRLGALGLELDGSAKLGYGRCHVSDGHENQPQPIMPLSDEGLLFHNATQLVERRLRIA